MLHALQNSPSQHGSTQTVSHTHTRTEHGLLEVHELVDLAAALLGLLLRLPAHCFLLVWWWSVGWLMDPCVVATNSSIDRFVRQMGRSITVAVDVIDRALVQTDIRHTTQNKHTHTPGSRPAPPSASPSPCPSDSTAWSLLPAASSLLANLSRCARDGGRVGSVIACLAYVVCVCPNPNHMGVRCFANGGLALADLFERR